jgi:hypothetical protein
MKSVDNLNNRTSININELSSELVGLKEQFDEEDALSVGVSIIWIDNYNEIPTILRSIRQGSHLRVRTTSHLK